MLKTWNVSTDALAKLALFSFLSNIVVSCFLICWPAFGYFAGKESSTAILNNLLLAAPVLFTYSAILSEALKDRPPGGSGLSISAVVQLPLRFNTIDRDLKLKEHYKPLHYKVAKKIRSLDKDPAMMDGQARV